jgi:hypothetical protein
MQFILNLAFQVSNFKHIRIVPVAGSCKLPQLKQSGINDDWKEIKRKTSTQKSVLTTAQNSYDKIIQIKRCTEPTEDLKQIHSALKQQKSKPFKQIKFVVHKPPSKKVETHAITQFFDT